MTNERADYAAQAILANHPNDATVKVMIDNPNDAKPTIAAFKRLGCKVKTERMGEVLIITKP